MVLTYPGSTSGDPRLDTNVASVVYPEQVLDSSNTPRIQLTYGTTGFELDKVTAQTWGGTNASGVVAGGSLSFEYTDLMVAMPALNDAVATTEVTDRNGNVTVYELNTYGLPVQISEATNRDVRGTTVDPSTYETNRLFNADEEVTSLTLPLGNEVETTYDTGNTDRYAHGNVLEVRRIADSARGGDGVGTAIADIVHRYRYEPIFQQVRLATSARGNDTGFTPPIADSEANVRDLDFNLDGDTNDTNDGETLRARRYTSETIYDYQEGTSSSIQTLASAEGVTVSSTQAAALSLGDTVTTDQNGDGSTSQAVGRPVEVRAPNVTLESGAVQEIVTNYRWNAFGQLVAEIDPEGYLSSYAYYPENAPFAASAGTTPNPPGRTLSSVTGGYLQQVVRDDSTALRTPAVSASRVDATTSFEYDEAGNVTAQTDPRGVVHTRTVNERNQVVTSVRAASTSSLNPEEPRSLTPLGYETRTYYDANDNVTKVEVENVVDQGGGNHQLVSGNNWLETTYVYDLLDDLIEQTQEVSAGESRSIRGQTLAVGSAETITTRFRYDRNQNQVLVISPAAVAGLTGQANNVTSQVVDERDMTWKTTRGGIDTQWSSIAAHGDIVLPMGVTTTARTATTRNHVDANGNAVLTIDADDDGSDHDGTTLPDTDDPTVAGTQRGDPTETLYDGFDRVVTTIDAMGYQAFTGCACSGGGGGPNAYDPDGNVLTRSAIGPAGDNLRGGGVNDKLLSRSRSLFDELSRVYRSEQDYWRTPQPVTSPTVEAVYVSTTLYDRSSRAIKQTRPMGDFVEFEHDGLGRVIRRKTNSMTGTAGTLVPSEVITRYDDAGNVVQTEEIERSVVTGTALTFYTDTFYDAVGRPDLRVSPHFSGNTANATRTEYDSRGNAVATLDANASGTTTIGVNRGGSVTLTINSTGNAVIQLHDGLGRVLATVRELRQGHDGSNSLDTSNPRNDDGLITTLQDWDASSRLVSVTDDEDTSVSPSSTNPSTTSFGYDDLDRRTTQTNADSEQQSTVYDLDGHVTSFTDENGSVISRTYDDLGRVTVVSVSRATGVEGTTTQTCEYDGLSRKTLCTDDNGQSVYNSEVVNSYDSLSRLQESTQTIGSTGTARVVTSEFDQNSNLIQLTYPGRIGGGSRRQVTYGYRDGSSNTLNRIELIEEGAGSGTGNAIVPAGTGSLRIATFGYIGPVRVETRQYGDGNTGAGVLMTKQYDALRRNTRVTHNDATTLGDFVDVEYAFDKNGNRLNEVFHHEGMSGVQDVYRYDSVGRLIREDRSATVGGITNNQAANPTATASENRTWDGLDGANNWNSVTGSGGFASLSITANEMNEYTVVNSVNRSHDDNGNLVDDGSKEYVYDAFNRLVRVVDKSSSVTLAHYAYDHGGRRVGRDVDHDLNTTFDEEVRYYYLGGSVVEEATPADVVLRQYVWGGGALLEYRTSDWSFEPIYCHENGYGSILRTTGQGTISDGELDEFDYNAYGWVTRIGGLQDSGLPIRLRGSWRLDPETGFYCVGSKLFDPALGRAVSRTGGAFNVVARTLLASFWSLDPLIAQCGGLAQVQQPDGDETGSRLAALRKKLKGFCGPDLTSAIVVSTKARRHDGSLANSWWPNMSVAYSLGNKATDDANEILRRASALKDATGCPSGACQTTITVGGVCLSVYNLRHILWMIYMEIAGLDGGFYGRLYEEVSIGNSGMDADLAINQVGVKIGRLAARDGELTGAHIRSAFANRDIKVIHQKPRSPKSYCRPCEKGLEEAEAELAGGAEDLVAEERLDDLVDSPLPPPISPSGP